MPGTVATTRDSSFNTSFGPDALPLPKSKEMGDNHMSSQIYGSVNDDDFIEIFNDEELQESSGANISMNDVSVGDSANPGSLSQRLTRVFRKSNFIILVTQEGASPLGETFLISDLPWTFDYDTKLSGFTFEGTIQS
jgi:hypothetical protein